MTQRITRSTPDRLLPSTLRTALVTGVAAAALFAAGLGARAQDAPSSPTDPTPQAANPNTARLICVLRISM